MFETDIQEEGNLFVVTPRLKRLDAVAAVEFRTRMVQFVQGRHLVVISMEHIDFMDSSGLGALVAVLKSLAPGGQLRLASVCERVRLLLKMTRLEKVLPTFATLADATA